MRSTVIATVLGLSLLLPAGDALAAGQKQKRFAPRKPVPVAHRRPAALTYGPGGFAYGTPVRVYGYHPRPVYVAYRTLRRPAVVYAPRPVILPTRVGPIVGTLVPRRPLPGPRVVILRRPVGRRPLAPIPPRRLPAPYWWRR